MPRLGAVPRAAQAHRVNVIFEESAPLRDILSRCVVASGAAPTAVAGVVRKSADGEFRAKVGAAGNGSVDTVFDLASLTKPFLAVTVSLLVTQNQLAWDTPLATLLPVVADCPAGAQPLEALLSHRAGLVPHIPLFLRRDAGLPSQLPLLLRRAASAVRPDKGSDALYSDLGYLLVGAGLARMFNQPLDAVLTQHLLEPLSLRVGSARMWCGSREQLFEIAPTEFLPRRGWVRGRVHDDNAWALSGLGLSGHAGLFGTLAALLRFGATLIDGRAGVGPLAPAMEPLLRCRSGGTWLLGFDQKSGPSSLAGTDAGPATFGHLGFTGTSLWCDPGRDAATVLLTNRVHPTRLNSRIRSARTDTQAALWAISDQVL